jgi:hypothetical protein
METPENDIIESDEEVEDWLTIPEALEYLHSRGVEISESSLRAHYHRGNLEGTNSNAKNPKRGGILLSKTALKNFKTSKSGRPKKGTRTTPNKTIKYSPTLNDDYDKDEWLTLPEAADYLRNVRGMSNMTDRLLRTRYNYGKIEGKNSNPFSPRMGTVLFSKKVLETWEYERKKSPGSGKPVGSRKEPTHPLEDEYTKLPES